MKNQWALQRQILQRYRELGILGHLPAFGGWAPWELAVKANDSSPDRTHATRGVCPEKDCDTAWLDGRDPLFTKVADAWMKQVMADFGSDHAWQMDEFFGNGTGWGLDNAAEGVAEVHEEEKAAVTYTKLAGTDTACPRLKGSGACDTGKCQALRCGVSTTCGKKSCHGRVSGPPCDLVALEKECTAD
eukprot:SAG11_NODE_2056_length_3877_cov_2.744574_1_plen_187_part_10